MESRFIICRGCWKWRCVIEGRLIPGLIVLLCISATPSFAAEQQAEPIRSAFSVRWENDAFGKTDANYTNGISLALTRTGRGVLGGLWDLGGEADGKRFAAYELTQLQFTPSDLKRSNPDPNDRPYAGLLYLGFTTHLQREESLHSLKLMAGVIGHASYSEGIQKFTHEALGYNLPNGWTHQLKNEPVVNLLYEYRYKYPLTPRDAAVGVELIPMGGAFLGNYLIQAQAEVQCRVGYHLPDDFGSTVLRGISYLPFPQDEKTHHAWGFYAFAGGAANLVARNLTLDGNTIAQSQSVDKRLFLPAAEFGASLWTRWFQTTFSYVMWGREFNGQPEREDYGSVLFSYFFR
ncbi:MAG: outer membrane [Geobacteraceae bacterium]|nr:MAG: outer membrane [Geobacteraceae bacterium]